ncbi:MAG: hypothetical protein DRQ55_11870 [Planctomycetota bacterium]|nr:MAG: hypothetical protein DRQ55_11870 [Planctomycetota bacterium]
MSGHPPTQTTDGLFARAREILRQSHKPDDFLWARWVSRPFAALALAALRRVPMTPNAISLVSLGVGLLSALAYGFWPGWTGLWIAWSVGQLAYIIDCMDGMQARARGLHSPAGTAMDFLVDAIKQMLLFPAIAYRVWVEAGQPLGLVQGWALWAAILSGPIVAAGLALTVFLRSGEVTGEVQRQQRADHDSTPAGRVMAGFAFLMNYPSWILVPVIFQRMDLFLIISLPLYAAYCAHALRLVWKRVCGFDHYAGRD